MQRLGGKRMQKLLSQAQAREKKVYKYTGAPDLTVDEMEYVVRYVWRYRRWVLSSACTARRGHVSLICASRVCLCLCPSPISKVGMLQGKTQVVCRWHQDKPLRIDNLILASRSDADLLAVRGVARLAVLLPVCPVMTTYCVVARCGEQEKGQAAFSEEVRAFINSTLAKVTLENAVLD